VRFCPPRNLPKPVKIISPPKEKFVRPTKPKAREVLEIVPCPTPRMVPLDALAGNDCRFPVGDPLKPEFGFCGHPRERGAYCAGHAALAYNRIAGHS
jgi:GcrA cell cycle regulator